MLAVFVTIFYYILMAAIIFIYIDLWFDIYICMCIYVVNYSISFIWFGISIWCHRCYNPSDIYYHRDNWTLSLFPLIPWLLGIIEYCTVDSLLFGLWIENLILCVDILFENILSRKSRVEVKRWNLMKSLPERWLLRMLRMLLSLLLCCLFSFAPSLKNAQFLKRQ